MKYFLYFFVLIYGLLHPGFVFGQVLCDFAFPALSTCGGGQCGLQINPSSGSTARVIADPDYGQQLGINFSAQSAFSLGDAGRINFGDAGGIEATFAMAAPIAGCVAYEAGSRPYSVDMSNGGWLDFSPNNLIQFTDPTVFILNAGSKIDGRLVIESPGSVLVSSMSGDVTVPNIDIIADGDIAISGQGGLQIGNLGSQATGDGGSSGAGISISAQGPVSTGVLNTAGAVNISAVDEISISSIDTAASIELTINSPQGGTITIGDSIISENAGPLIIQCDLPQNCNDFNPGNGPSNPTEACNPDDYGPDEVNPCGGGGSTCYWWISFLAGLFLLVLSRRKAAGEFTRAR